MNEEAFFAAVRGRIGRLSQSQVDGINAILTAASGRPRSHVAYLLATAWRETARSMRPIKETVMPHHKDKNPTDATVVARLDKAWKTGRLRDVKIPYWRFDDTGRAWFGRGYVQLTHKKNYQKAAAMVGADLLGNPSLALEPRIAARVLVEGCDVGLFTGTRLADYLPGDYVNARKIVNGLDHAFEIAADAEGWEAALKAGGYKTDTGDFRPVEPRIRDVALTVPGQRDGGQAAKKPGSGAKSGIGAVLTVIAAALAYWFADVGERISNWFGG